MKKTEMLSFRLSESDKERLIKYAKENGKSVTQILADRIRDVIFIEPLE